LSPFRDLLDLFLAEGFELLCCKDTPHPLAPYAASGYGHEYVTRSAHASGERGNKTRLCNRAALSLLRYEPGNGPYVAWMRLVPPAFE
jgi:hypothetical protein